MFKPAVRRSAGFTLIELTVTTAVIAILAIVAIPNLRDFVLSNRLRSTANELVAALQTARMEAVRLNTRTVVCRSNDGTTCIGSNGAWSGWVVMGDVDRDGAVDDVLRVGGVQAPVTIQTSSNIQSGSITFRPDGIARTAASTPLQANISVCVPVASLAQNIRVVSIRTGSRLATTQAAGSGQCNTPENPS